MPNLLVDRTEAQALALKACARVALKRKAAAEFGPDQAIREPNTWLTKVLGVKHDLSTVFPKQLSMFSAIRDHSQVSCSGANSSGKDWAAGRIALWWMQTHDDAKVVIMAPSFRQVKIVWSEIRDAYFNARVDLGGRIYEEPYLKWSERRYIIGFSTDKPYKATGHHSENLLAIVSEAHGVPQKHIEALNRLNPVKVLMTGNPISESGEFYASHHEKAYLWRTIGISAFDTPNVIAGYRVIPGLITRLDIDRHARNWGEDSPLYRMTVLNEWVENMGSLVVVPVSWAQQAEFNEFPPGPIEVVSCDPARYGTDYSTIWTRRGKVVRLIWRKQGADTMETAGVLNDYYSRHHAAHFVVDGVGLGAGIVDRLREQGLGVIDFQGGAAASNPTRFVNRIAECWWRMREGYCGGLDTPDDSVLRSQVCSRKYKIKSDKRIELESKEKMRQEGRQSPDDGDAVAMSFALDYDLYGDHLSATSDVPLLSDLPEEEQVRRMEAYAGEQERATLEFGRTPFAPAQPSRWSRIKGNGGRGRGRR